MAKLAEIIIRFSIEDDVLKEMPESEIEKLCEKIEVVEDRIRLYLRDNAPRDVRIKATIL